jgi:hypothetical protein
MTTRHTPLLLLAAALAATPGCEDRPAPTPATRETPQSVLGGSAKMARDVKGQVEASQQQAAALADSITNASNFTEIGSLRFIIPDNWTKQPAGGMRLAQYSVDGPAGPAEVVFFAIRGDAASNIARWKRQITPTAGQNPVVRERLIQAGTIKVHTVVLEGTYTGMGPSGQPGEPKPDTRFLGAFLETPAGTDPVQVRVTGPIDTVTAIEQAWESMLAGTQTR